MARIALFSLTFLLFCCAAIAESTFEEDSNPIRLVSDGVHDFEPSVLEVIGLAHDALSFARFAHRYGKKYETVEETMLRFQIFSMNLKLIRSSNKKGLPYTLAVNHFADLSWEEFRRQRLGAAPNYSATLKGNYKLTDVILPETKDWREEGIVSPVKDQGGCGACWAFSATGALEAAYKQAYGNAISLSEQQLVDCAPNNDGCDGGMPSRAFQYIKSNGGLDTDEAYPYTAKNGTCKFSTENVGVKVLDFVDITWGAEDELKEAIALVRPVTVAFQVLPDFQFYETGVYTDNICGKDVNHAVLAIGYGVEDGVPYWLVKNSWGKNWGDNGFFKIEMGKNMCGIANYASYPIVA